MAYEQNQTYINTFDKEQSPLWMSVLAERSGTNSDCNDVYLDLGCAAGHSTLALAPLYPDITFIGVDFNSQHIRDAKSEATRLKLDNIKFFEADFRSMPKDLPVADFIIVRGIYSWLSKEVQTALESVISRYANKYALLRLHYNVLPGSILRESLREILYEPQEIKLTPSDGRARALILKNQAPILNQHLPHASAALESYYEKSDSMWVHDLLNPDFSAEYSYEVMKRMGNDSYYFAASTSVDRNIPLLLVNDSFRALLNDWHNPRTQTKLDILTFNSARNDLFVRNSHPDWVNGQYSPNTRFGLVVPNNLLLKPVTMMNGTLKFENPIAVSILDAMKNNPITFSELEVKFSNLTPLVLRDWIDLLWAANKIAPFLPKADVARIDREKLRRVNKERIGWSVRELSPNIRLPLLAAEYGGCMVAGWFECLVLEKFEKRHQLNTKREIIEKMRKAGMAFRSTNGQPAKDQMTALNDSLDLLDNNFLSRMGYWGIDV